MSFEKKLKTIQNLFIDSLPFIYFVEKNKEFNKIASVIFKLLDENKIRLFTSVITLTEILTKPYSARKIKLVENFQFLIQNTTNLKVIYINYNIAIEAAKLRAKYNSLRTIDAIQVATAMENKCEVFVTNDLRLKNISETEIILLKNYI